jgi:putative heme-binding domain-containing protein
MDTDGSGRLYVASWRNGSAVGFEGPNIGFVARVTPKGLKAEPFPDLKEADVGGLVALLAAPHAVTRLHAQGETLARGKHPDTTKALVGLASDTTAPLEGRVATIFTLKQFDGKDSHPALVKLAGDSAVREFALRALTDRKKELEGLDAKPLVSALTDESSRVRGQACVSLSRLGDASVAKNLFPLTARPKGSAMPTTRPLQNQPDPDRVVPHLAVRALVALNATDACLEALDGPHWQGSLWAMRYLHSEKAVEGLIKKLGTTRTPELRRGILGTLIRLYHREADYKGSWWGIRPDNTGPYYERFEWEQSKRIGSVITAAALDGDKEMLAFLKAELTRHRVSLPGLPGGSDTAKVEPDKPIVLPKADPNNPNQIGNMTYEVATRRTFAAKGDATKGKSLFKAQSCVACHTDADGQTPKGPHLADIGKRLKPDEMIESILKPSAKLAQGYESYRFVMTDERVFTGFVVGERADATVIREANGVQRELKKADISLRQQQKNSAMSEGIAANLTPDQLADLIAYLQSLK